MASKGGGMNKMFAILPVYFISSKLDWEDPMILNYVRVGYFVEQAILIAGCAFLYFKVQGNLDTTVIYVKKPPSFSVPKPKWEKTSYAEHEMSEIYALAQQLVMGLLMTTFLHFKMGVKQSILMQACMMPITFTDCPVCKRYFFGKGDNGERVYDEKLEGEDMPEEEEDDAIASDAADASSIDDSSSVETSGKSQGVQKATSAGGSASDFATLKRLIQGTWDSGKSAKYGPLMKALNNKNVDTKTDSDFTSLMIVAAGVGDVTVFVQKILDLGADVHVKDDEGWTALHWAAFHGNLSGVSALCKFSSEASQLKATKDSDGKVPLDYAKSELELAETELSDLKKELKNGDGSEAMNKQQLEAKEKQVETKQNIVKVLSDLSSASTGVTENLHEID